MQTSSCREKRCCSLRLDGPSPNYVQSGIYETFGYNVWALDAKNENSTRNSAANRIQCYCPAVGTMKYLGSDRVYSLVYSKCEEKTVMSKPSKNMASASSIYGAYFRVLAEEPKLAIEDKVIGKFIVVLAEDFYNVRRYPNDGNSRMMCFCQKI